MLLRLLKDVREARHTLDMSPANESRVRSAQAEPNETPQKARSGARRPPTRAKVAAGARSGSARSSSRKRKATMYKFEIYRDWHGDYKWRLRSSAGRVVAVS